MSIKKHILTTLILTISLLMAYRFSPRGEITIPKELKEKSLVDFKVYSHFINQQIELPQIALEIIKEKKETSIVPIELKISPVKELIIKQYENSKKINSDVIGVINVPNTSINLPIVYSTEELFYLDRSLNKTIDKIGVPYLHYKIPTLKEEILVVQGHNLKNGKAFTDLKNFTEEKFAEANTFIYLYDGVNLYKCNIFSIRVLDANAETLPLAFANNIEKSKYYNEMASKSYLKLNPPNTSKRLLILSTCTSIRQQDRIVLWCTLDNILVN